MGPQKSCSRMLSFVGFLQAYHVHFRMQTITNFIDGISREGDNVHLVLSATKYLNPRYWANSFQISSQFWSFQNGFNVKLNLHLASGTLKRLHNDPKSVEHLIALLACLEFQCKERKKCAIELDQMYTYFVELSCPLLRFHSETLLATPIFLSWLETKSWSAKVVAIVIEKRTKDTKCFDLRSAMQNQWFQGTFHSGSKFSMRTTTRRSSDDSGFSFSKNLLLFNFDRRHCSEGRGSNY